MGRRFMKSSLENLLFTRFRTIVILCCGCSLFFLLHNTFGGLRSPSVDRADTFPRKIWQSWKVDSLRFEARDAERAMTWTLKNPAYRYEVLTDENAVTYVEQHYGPNGFNRPDIVSIYKGLNARIIQADLLRYLIMYVEGGLWADIDVEAIRPIDHFIPKRHSEHDVGMVVGVETDEPALKDHPVLGAKATSFCQWTFMCKPRLPVMMRLIDNILIWLSRLAVEQGRPISELELNFDEVLNGTGPSAFTTAILAEMAATTGRKYTWDDFHDLEESKVVGGVLVLTSEAFAAGTGHSDSGNHHGKGALVKHHFHASSWTTNHPRFKHPIYGEVEKCNWDVECVKLWDANTAFFASLPKEDQRKMIGLKDREETAAALDAEFAAAMPVLPKAGPPPAALPEAPKNDLPILEGGGAQEPLAPAQAEAQPVDVPAGNAAPLLADAPPAIAGLGVAAAQAESQPEARSDPQQEIPAGIPEGLEPGLAPGLDQVDWPAAAPAEPVGELVENAQ